MGADEPSISSVGVDVSDANVGIDVCPPILAIVDGTLNAVLSNSKSFVGLFWTTLPAVVVE